MWTGVDPGEPNRAAPGGGGELVLWGPTDADFASTLAAPGGPRGVAFDPATHAWRTLPEAPLEPRTGHTLTWTGEEVIAWGGQTARAGGRGVPLTDGAAYDPESDAWRPLHDARTGAGRAAPLGREPAPGESATWTGRAVTLS